MGRVEKENHMAKKSLEKLQEESSMLEVDIIEGDFGFIDILKDWKKLKIEGAGEALDTGKQLLKDLKTLQKLADKRSREVDQQIEDLNQ
jgi:hypothetical protein